MAHKDVPIIVCDVCEKSTKQTKAKGNWLHIQFHAVFGIKPTAKLKPTDLCSARCAKKWAANHPAFQYEEVSTSE